MNTYGYTHWGLVAAIILVSQVAMAEPSTLVDHAHNAAKRAAETRGTALALEQRADQRARVHADGLRERAADLTRAIAEAPRREIPGYEVTDERAASDEARGLEEEPGIEAEDVVLALPRAILFVPKLAIEIVFWPVSQGLLVVQKYAVIEHVRDFLYNDERTAGILPTGAFSTTQGLMLGAVVFHDDLFGAGESGSLSAEYGSRFQQAYEAEFFASHLLHSSAWLDMRAEYRVTPSSYFGGIGIQQDNDVDPTIARVDARQSNEITVYSGEEIRGIAGAGHTFGARSERVRTGFYSVFEDHVFEPSSRDGWLTSIDEPSLENVYEPSSIPGFESGVSTLAFFWVLEADFRSSRGLRQSGTFFELYAGGNPGIGDWAYAHVGSELSYTIALFKETRLLHLRASYEGVEGDAPFTTLPRLGGSHRLRGYVDGQYRDQHASLASVEYFYPIHKNVSGSLFVDAGYVSRDIEGLAEFDEYKLGGGGGFLVGSPESISLRLQVAYGADLEVFVGTDLARSLDGFLERP